MFGFNRPCLPNYSSKLLGMILLVIKVGWALGEIPRWGTYLDSSLTIITDLCQLEVKHNHTIMSLNAILDGWLSTKLILLLLVLLVLLVMLQKIKNEQNDQETYFK